MQKYKYLELDIEYVFKGNFNDSYYLETIYFDLNDLVTNELVWIDPYNGKSKIGDTLIAIKYYSDEKYIILKKQKDEVKEFEYKIDSLFICAEDYDESMLLASHIRFKKEKR